MIPLTFFAHTVAGLHFGLWIQRPFLALIPLCIAFPVLFAVLGKGTVSYASFWVLRPAAYVLGLLIAHLFYVLFGSPVARYRVFVESGAAKSVLAVNPKQAIRMLATSAQDYLYGTTAVSHGAELAETHIRYWPLHATIPNMEKGQTLPQSFVAHDLQLSSYYGHSPYMLAFTPGHQKLWELFIFHTLFLAGGLIAWEHWPPHSSRTPWGFMIFGAAYALGTILLASIIDWGKSRLWSSPFKTRAFWISWLITVLSITACASGLAYIDTLGEFWSGSLVPFGVGGVMVFFLFRVWCFEAARLNRVKDSPMPFFPVVCHPFHPVRNLVGTYATLLR